MNSQTSLQSFEKIKTPLTLQQCQVQLHYVDFMWSWKPTPLDTLPSPGYPVKPLPVCMKSSFQP